MASTKSENNTESKGSGSAKKNTRPRRRPVKARGAKLGGMSGTTIALFTAAAIFALGILGYAGYKVWDKNQPFGEQAAQKINGVHNYRKEDPKWLTNRHVEGELTYKVSPSVGGDHNSIWQNCMGDIYTQEIPEEHATHSLEHGAVWITYRPDLPADQVAKLQEKVQGRDFMLMSPYPNLDSPITLQAWGFNLKVDSADDKRIDEFIKAFRKEASIERGAGCSGGNTQTGTAPVASDSQGMVQQ